MERGLHVLVATQAVARQPAVGELELMADGPSGALRKLVAMTPREDKLLVAQPALVPQLAQTEICSKNRDSDQHQARLTMRVLMISALHVSPDGCWLCRRLHLPSIPGQDLG